MRFRSIVLFSNAARKVTSLSGSVCVGTRLLNNTRKEREGGGSMNLLKTNVCLGVSAT